MSASKMRVLVGVKRVVDYSIKVRVNAQRTAVETSTVKHSMNPFCEIATEEAVRLKEAGLVHEIVAVSIGPKSCTDTLRTALAMGCDRALHIETPLRTDSELQTLSTAKVFAALASDSKYADKYNSELILLGKQSIDDDSNHTGQMVAARLGWAQATYASKVQWTKGSREMLVTREIDGGLQTLKLQLPAVVTADLRLNVPRYATLPNIMKAKKKPFETLQLTDILTAQELAPRTRVTRVEEPAVRKGGIKVNSVDELVDKLRNEAKVI